MPQSDSRMLMQGSCSNRLGSSAIRTSLVRKVTTMVCSLAWTSWLNISTPRFRAECKHGPHESKHVPVRACKPRSLRKLRSHNSRLYTESYGKAVPRQTCSGARLSLESTSLSSRKEAFRKVVLPARQLSLSRRTVQTVLLRVFNRKMLHCKPAPQLFLHQDTLHSSESPSSTT